MRVIITAATCSVHDAKAKTETTLYKWEDCGDYNFTVKNFRRHLLQHHGQACTEEGCQFWGIISLKAHSLIEHQKEIKDSSRNILHQCPTCKEINYTWHMTQEHLIICDDCTLVFVSEANLQEHQIKKQKIDSTCLNPW